MGKQGKFQIISHWVCVVGLSGVFLTSSVLKLLDLPAFYQSILSFHLISGTLALIPVYIVPSFELVCGIALWIPMLKRGASVCLAFLMILFTLMLADAWQRGIDVSCGCFGKADAASFTAAKGIARDIVFFAMAAWVFFTSRNGRNRKLEPVLG